MIAFLPNGSEVRVLDTFARANGSVMAHVVLVRWNRPGIVEVARLSATRAPDAFAALLASA